LQDKKAADKNCFSTAEKMLLFTGWSILFITCCISFLSLFC